MAKISINLKDGTVKKDEPSNHVIIGIDLGTTNSLVAYIKDGEAEILKKEGQETALVPSVIHFDENGEVVIGQEAKKKLISEPHRTLYSVKRLMGKSYQDLVDVAQNLGYEIIDEDADKLVKVKIGKKYYTPIELSAQILKSLKSIAEKQLNQSVSKAVITVPAYFNDAQRQATRDAGRLAGLDVLRIVNEPTAASLAYGIGANRADEEIVAVYDLGGGTFDVSILEIQNGVFEVLSTHGDTFLGGDDFDRAIVDYWIEKYGLQLEGDKKAGQELRLLAENAKKTLSQAKSFTAKFDKNIVSIDKDTFQELTKDLIARTIDSCQQALNDAQLTKADINKVVLVGGSTRVQEVKQAVQDFFGDKLVDDLDPDQVVALGAAVQADILAGNRADMLLLDVTPLSLGIETVGGLMDTIIPRNSKVPIKAGRQYTTSVDGQVKLKVAVYQGERDLVEDNRKLGEFILSGIPPMAAGMPKIDIQFMLDADGILRVRARELRANIETEVQIKAQYGISEEEMALMLKSSLEHAESDMKKRALIEARTELQNVVHSGEKFADQNASVFSDEEWQTFEKHLDQLRQAKTLEDSDQIHAAIDEFNAYSRPLAERAMDYHVSVALKGQKMD